MKTLTDTDLVHSGEGVKTPEGEIGVIDEDQLLGKHPIPGRPEPETEVDSDSKID